MDAADHDLGAHDHVGRPRWTPQYVGVEGGSHGVYDWKIEIYRSGQSRRITHGDPSNDGDLSDYRIERLRRTSHLMIPQPLTGIVVGVNAQGQPLGAILNATVHLSSGEEVAYECTRGIWLWSTHPGPVTVTVSKARSIKQVSRTISLQARQNTV